jgi:WD40 repeat protein
MVIFSLPQQKIISQPYGMLKVVKELEHMVIAPLSLVPSLSPGSHKGAVWDLDPSWDSQYLLTACADGSARLFETCTGKYIAKMPHKGSVSPFP